MQNVTANSTTNRLIKTTTETITCTMNQVVTWQKNKVSEASKATFGTLGAEWCMVKGVDSVGAEGDFRVFKTSWDAALLSKKDSVVFQLAVDLSDINRARSFIVLPSGTDHTQALIAKLQAEVLAERKAEQELFMARVQGLAPVNHLQLTPAQQALAATVTAVSPI